MMPWLTTFWLLLIAHAFTDYVWQTELMGWRKSPVPHPPVPPYEIEKYGPWWWHMSAHSLVNAGGVLVITHSIPCSLGEFLVHGLTDYAKCRHWISTNADQAIHILSKGLWAWLSLW